MGCWAEPSSVLGALGWAAGKLSGLPNAAMLGAAGACLRSWHAFARYIQLHSHQLSHPLLLPISLPSQPLPPPFAKE